MIKAHIIFKKNGKKLEPTKIDKEFADHAEMEAFRKQLIESENLSEITFLYTDFNPKLCKCGRQMVFDVVKNKYVCDCN
jgi:hypothetical protein